MCGRLVRIGLIAALAAGSGVAAQAQGAFPFDAEVTLDAAPMRGSKRIPNIEFGPRGEATIELWCKGARGQFAVSGSSVTFVRGAVEDRNCAPDRAAADDALIAALEAVTGWSRRGNSFTLTGAAPLRFFLNSN
jgi:heat shock protein HslJ